MLPELAVLDANAIWSASERDILLWVAAERLYYPRWTRQILDEMTRTLLTKRLHLSPAALERTVRRMNAYFPEAMVEGYQQLIPAMQNHPGDRHVLAAAVYAKAPLIVTWNLIHFPRSICDPLEVTVMTPDDFLHSLWIDAPEGIVRALERQSAELRNPPQTVRQTLENLRRSIPRFAEAVLLSGMVE